MGQASITGYCSIIFYRNPEGENILLGLMKKINQSKHYPKAVITQVVPLRIPAVKRNNILNNL